MASQQTRPARGMRDVLPEDVRIIVAAGPPSILIDPVGEDTSKRQVQIVRDHLPLARPLAVAIEDVILEVGNVIPNVQPRANLLPFLYVIGKGSVRPATLGANAAAVRVRVRRPLMV